VTLLFTFPESIEPISVTVDVTPVKGLPFFGKKEDIGGLVWHMQWKHGGIQSFAYDCMPVNILVDFHPIDPAGEEEHSITNTDFRLAHLRAGGSEEVNEDWLGWGVPVYSMTDGIVECVRSESIDIEPYTFYLNHPNEINLHDNPMGPPARGRANEIIVRTPDDLLIQYSHFQKNSIPPEIIPGYTIHTGDKIGLVGNSGRSKAPHLHIHVVSKPAQVLSMRKSILDQGFDIPLSVSETFFDNKMKFLDEKASLSLVIGTNLDCNTIPDTSRGYWPYPLSFNDALYTSAIARGQPVHNAFDLISDWVRLDDSAPPFVTLDDSNPQWNTAGDILPTRFILLDRGVVNPGTQEPF
jgi:hypothetical protein